MDGSGGTPAGDATSGAAAVEMSGVIALLGGFPALSGLDLTVARGEVVLVAGPNGAGKTTLLNVCGGLVPVARGSAHVLGVDLTGDRAALRHRVGLLGHRNGLYGDLTVSENLTFWSDLVGATPEETARSVEAAGLAGRLADVKVTALSAGQRRRTALAVLLIRRAELWLLDEPHAGLDPDGRGELDALIRLAAASGVTVMLASHDLDRSRDLADREVTVVGGAVVEAA
ncbi:MAG: heme ABC exporter ATP-binding protein CcmA [Ilumatobacteraceae bacterium]